LSLNNKLYVTFTSVNPEESIDFGRVAVVNAINMTIENMFVPKAVPQSFFVDEVGYMYMEVRYLSRYYLRTYDASYKQISYRNAESKSVLRYNDHIGNLYVVEINIYDDSYQVFRLHNGNLSLIDELDSQDAPLYEH
jgi:hypothetical protein